MTYSTNWFQAKLAGLIRDHRRLQNRRRKNDEVEKEALAAPDTLEDDLNDLLRGPRSNRSTMLPEHRRRLHPVHVIRWASLRFRLGSRFDIRGLSSRVSARAQ
jgi:hypothetical protein